MLTAVIESGNDTLLVELPKSVFDLQMNLMSIGVRFPPNEIPLRDEESSSLRVKLYGQNEVGQKLCLLLSETDMLSTANLAAYLLTNAEPAVKDAIEAQLQVGQYRTAQELIADIKDKTLDAGPVKLALYFPITGYLDDGEEPAYPKIQRDKLETWNAFLRRIHTVTEFRKDGTIREVPHETV